MEKEQKAILKAIDIMIDQKLKKLSFNYYVDGVIQDGVVTDGSTKSRTIPKNVYSVLINGVVYDNIPSMNKMDYCKGDVVRVLIKNGDWNKKFIEGIANHTKFPIAQQYNSLDGRGVEYPLICDNTTNLWIGALERKSRHHSGKGSGGRVYISTGYNEEAKKGHPTIRVAVPNETNNDATIYDVMHSGNLIDYTYPVGSVYISSTNTNPSNSFGGTWELIDKEFTPITSNSASMFTINSENTTSVTPSFSRSNHAIYTRINFVNKIELSDTAYTIGTFDLAQLGVTELTYQKYVVGYSDGGNAVFMATLTDKGVLTVVDVVGKESTTTIPANSSCWIEYIHEVQINSMLDSACNKFYWKRTA